MCAKSKLKKRARNHDFQSSCQSGKIMKTMKILFRDAVEKATQEPDINVNFFTICHQNDKPKK